jgi:hypothetical protein
VSPLSEHLFWDVDSQRVDPETHAAWLVRRVLEYGRWRDWQTLVSYYGKERLREIVTSLPSLDPRCFAFCCAWFETPPTEFRCFPDTPSRTK